MSGLYHADGSLRTTSASTRGRALEQHERALQRHRDQQGQRLGSVRQAISALNLEDAAELWDAVADGRLVAKQEALPSQEWTIYRP